MDYKLENNIRDNHMLRSSFIELADKTFGLSFEEWYLNGYWTEKYIPYALLDKGKVIANVSVNLIDTIWNNQPRRYIQLGTVMTDMEYRNNGLSRRLIETILLEWKEKCEMIYLFANDTVLDFYPKFGFQKAVEYQCSMASISLSGKTRKLDMSSRNDRDFLAKYYRKSNPFSALPMIGNFGLLMFYCSLIKDFIYYCEDYDAVIIAEHDGKDLICYDIYCDSSLPMLSIISAIETSQTANVYFKFPLKETGSCIQHAIEGDDETLFVLPKIENIFKHNKLMFPALSHA